MSTDFRNFNRLRIQELYGTAYTDIVAFDGDRGGTLLFASIVVINSLTKQVNKLLNRQSSIYSDHDRRYINTNGQKYEVIKKKMPFADYTHLIFSRKDKVEHLENGVERYDFCLYTQEQDSVASKLYDKLYELTSIPVMEEWMPAIMNQLIASRLMNAVTVSSIHTEQRLTAYRVVVTKDQLCGIITGLMLAGQINIQGTTQKSDVIDCVTGLDSYLNIFGDILAERIQNSFVPKFDPSQGEYDEYVNNYDDSCFHNGIDLYNAQKAVIQASVNNLKVNNATFLIGEMGCGKTALGAGIAYADYGKKTGSTSVIICPSHLVEKWKREVERLVPNGRGYIVKTIKELINLDGKIRAKVKLEHTFIIINKENAKFSYETRPSAIWKPSKNTFVCPECGQMLTKRVKYGTGREAVVIDERFEKTDLLKEMAYNRRCMNEIVVRDPQTGANKKVPCNAKLWTPLNKHEENPKWIKLGKTGWIMLQHVDDIFNMLVSHETLTKKEGELLAAVVDLQNAMEDGDHLKGIRAPRKYSLAKYIRERYKGMIDYCIADEMHEYSGDSKQGRAMSDIARASNKFIGLTGTLLNGYADGLFYILYRTLPQLMRKETYEYSSEAEFMRDYGVMRKNSSFRATGSGGRGDRINSSETRLPGVSPLVFTKFLLENAVFLSLSDMDGGLPGYQEIPLEVEMDDELKEAYSSLEVELRRCVGVRGSGGMKAMGSLLQCLSVYPDMPYDQPPVIHPDTGEILVTPPALAAGTRRKEAQLLELVQDKIAKGEKVLLYYEWTKKTDIAQRLTEMFKENGIRSATMTSSVTADTREEWIEKKVKKGLDVLICNPKLVETGLDLLDFTTIVFYQVGYSIFTMRQASRRSWRLSQDKDIEVYFIYYKETIQDRALKLMATKLQASMAIEGKFSEEGLRAMSNNEDLLSQIAQSVVEGIKDTVETATFTSTERSERIHDESRERTPMSSLLIRMPNVIHLSCFKQDKAIKKNKLSSNKSAFRNLLNFNAHVGNLY